ALLAAAKIRDSDIDRQCLVKLGTTKLSQRTKINTLYRLFNSFAERPKAKDLKDLFNPVSKWQYRAEAFIHLIEKFYPRAHKQISSTDLTLYKSWQEWFFSVIDSLDEFKSDSVTWNETSDFISEKQEAVYDSSLVGWEVLRAILHRYEAYAVIHESKRPRGP